MRAIWVNDIHLEFLDDRGRHQFFHDLNRQAADCILIAGDIGQARSIEAYLMEMESVLSCPIYFVLGNHDYYYGSISGVRSRITRLTGSSRCLRWLNRRGVTRLTETTALIGHDGWGDGRLGDFHGSDVQLNDFVLISELAGLSRSKLLEALRMLGDETAEHLRVTIPEALAVSDHVVVVTHVPPFREAAWYNGKYSDPNWLPFFACKASGDVLSEAMIAHPSKRMTVLCGHTHGGGTSQMLPNLVTYTGPAQYGRPVIQKVFEWC